MKPKCSKPFRQSRHLRPRMHAIRIRGWSWTELLPIFGVAYPDDMGYESFYAYLCRERIYKAAAIIERYEVGNQDVAKGQMRLARKFCLTRSRDKHCYDRMVWKAISEVENDWTFAQWLGTFIQSAWT